MAGSNLFPRTRREVQLAAACLTLGIGLTLGLTRLPGLTFEPQELTSCREALAVKDAKLIAAQEALVIAKGTISATEARVRRCWERSHETRVVDPREPE